MNRPVRRLLSGKFGADLEIRILMRQTAKVFGEDAPKSRGLSASKLLESYARFSADAALRAVKSGQDLTLLHHGLYHMAHRLGKILRLLTGPRDEKECFEIITLIYRNIGITLNEESAGEICVHKCYFSDYYTPEVCFVISAIDQGLFAGICKGGTLSFRERITEGYEVCRADFK